METRYARPDDETIDALVAACLPDVGDDREIVETGSSALVVLTGDAAIRIARDAVAAEAMLRTQHLVDRLPALPFAVPRSLGAPVQRGPLVAVATRRLSGRPHPAGSGDAAALRRLLDAIHAVDVAPLRPWLAEPHAFSGGVRWLSVLRDRVVPLLPAEKRAGAIRIVEEVAATADAPRALNHGDLAGSNVLWQDGRVSGVLDWDLAARCDPADDVASLAQWHGWHLVDELADADTVQRAASIRRTYPLQVVAFALLHDRPSDEVARAVTRACERLP